MQLNILIIDDDINFTLQLQNDLNTMFENCTFEIKTDDFLNIESKTIDVAFFDIDLKKANGIKIAQRLKLLFPTMLVIFVSSREEFVFNTFVVDVFQFVRKVNYNKDILIVLNQLKEHFLKYNQPRLYTIKGRRIAIHPKKIKYILSIGHDITIYEDEVYTFRSTLQAILDDFQVNYLVQINKNLIINFYFVKSLKKNEITTLDKKVYRVGRSYQSQLMKQYEAFLLE